MIGQANGALSAKLPPPEVYETEYRYWPWGELLRRAATFAADHVPKHGHVIDYMCGTGFLLNLIAKQRPDLTLEGCDINQAYVEYAGDRYPHTCVQLADARAFNPSRSPDLVLCTAGFHHLTRPDQIPFLAKVAEELPSGGNFLIAEELIAPYKDETQRQHSVVQMGMAMLDYIIEKKAPPAVLEAATDVICNDLLERGEYKTSRVTLESLLATSFRIKSTAHVWPGGLAPFGDVILFCEKVAR